MTELASNNLYQYENNTYMAICEHYVDSNNKCVQ